MRSFLLLDRDGTLIREKDFLHDPDGVELLPGAVESVRKARALGWGVAVVTNQSGVGREMFTMADVDAVHARIASDLKGEGLEIDAFYVCPHKADDGCDCRKPGRALGDRAASELGAELETSVMVGDKALDLEFGRAIGATTVLVRTGYGAATSAEHADYVIESLEELPRILGQHDRIARHLAESIRVKQEVRGNGAADIVALAEEIAESMGRGGKLMICGNGGSAADCQHLATEFVVRLSSGFVRPALPAIALTVDSSILTAYVNDYDFEGVFARQIEALGKAGDVLLGISTSGNSPNVVAAVKVARGKGIRTLGLLGGDGGRLRELVDRAVVVPSPSTLHVQESHLAIYHLLCDLVEKRLFSD